MSTCIRNEIFLVQMTGLVENDLVQ